MRLLLRSLLGSVLILMTMTGAAFAQAGTFNGRVLDQGDAVLPGVSVTAVNVSTGVSRTTVTNAEGLYFMPGLDPGIYDVKSELAGFSPAARERVTLGVNATLTLDFRMRVAALNETITVTGDAPVIEVTQSKVASTIQANQLENLPMITRSVSGMLALLPGAAPMAPTHRSKENVGSVSFGGASGTNVMPTVDGADNRDNRYGGPLLTFTTEALEQFQLATSQFTAADGRTGGAALTMVTKSGTNVLHGSAFLFARDRSMTAKDYFTKASNQEKAPFNRKQFGGSVGGPIVRNRMFFFGALEQVQDNTAVPVPDELYYQLQLLVPLGLANPNHPHAGPTPGRLKLYTVKVNDQLTNTQSMMVRYAGQRDYRDAVTFNVRNDLREPENSGIKMWSAVVQHNWVLGNRGLNQLTGQVNHLYRLSDVTSAVTGEHYTRDFPRIPVFSNPPSLSFPSVTVGAGGAGGSLTDTYVIQLKDDVSQLLGNHALKTGIDIKALPKLGLLNANEHFPTVTFFDDPWMILTNGNGRYPQGFSTPGVARQWQQGNPVRSEDINYGAKQFATWFQDDWRATARLTLNLGVRYDVDIDFYDQRNIASNATRQVLLAIGNTGYTGVPRTPTKDISPRVGFALDLSGDGRHVLRGGYGLYFDQFNTGGAGDASAQNKRPLNALATLTNTDYGVGQLATYRFLIDPLPPQPKDANTLPRGAAGEYLAPDLTDPRNHQMHVGYAHQLAANTAVSVDYTHIIGRHEFRRINLNPIVNGTRLLAPDFMRVYGIPNVLNAINILTTDNRSRYDALTVQFQRRMPRVTLQAHYTLAGAYAYGGSTGNRSGATVAQDQFDQFAKGEWGPTGNDERHRGVVMGVFDLAYGIQVSPVYQAASARPYTLTAGQDLNRDGTNNDRYVDPATGKQVAVNSQRGDPTSVLDVRTTKFFSLSGERKIGVFAEVFNLFNTLNFGNAYTGNARSASFRQPTGFIPGIGYARQLQLGARFLF
jgi:Carboxypeptidase regulatory-like domain